MFPNCLRRTSPRNLLFSYPYRGIILTDKRKTKTVDPKTIDPKWLEEKEDYRHIPPNNFFYSFASALKEHFEEKREEEKKIIHVQHHGLIFAGVCYMFFQTFFK